MRWIRRLLRRRPEPVPQRSDTPGRKEAESALSRSRDARREIHAYWPEVTRHADRFRHERERNHFAELFRAALEGDH